jgi:hypothetical protein
MFRIEVFVEDKRLAEALRALAGIVRGQPAVTPVANVEEASGKPKAISNGTTLAMFEKYIGTRKSEAPLSPDDLRNWMKANGKSPSSASSLAVSAVEAGLIRRTGKSSSTRYHIKKKG